MVTSRDARDEVLQQISATVLPISQAAAPFTDLSDGTLSMLWLVAFVRAGNSLAIARMVLEDSSNVLTAAQKADGLRALRERLDEDIDVLVLPCAELILALLARNVHDTLTRSGGSPGQGVRIPTHEREALLERLDCLSALLALPEVHPTARSNNQLIGDLLRLLQSAPRHAMSTAAAGALTFLAMGDPASQQLLRDLRLAPSILPRRNNGEFINDGVAELHDVLVVNGATNAAIAPLLYPAVEMQASHMRAIYSAIPGEPSGSANATIVVQQVGIRRIFEAYHDTPWGTEPNPMYHWEFFDFMILLVKKYPEAQDACRDAGLLPYLLGLTPDYYDNPTTLASLLALVNALVERNPANQAAYGQTLETDNGPMNMLNAMETALETYETQNEDFGDSIKYHAMTAMRSLIVKNDANLQAARCLKLEPLLRRLRDQSENEEGERELAASLLQMLLV